MQTCTEGLQGYSRSKIKPLIFMCGIYRQLWDFSPMTVFYTMHISMDIMTASFQALNYKKGNSIQRVLHHHSCALSH